MPGIATLASTQADLQKVQQSIKQLQQIATRQAFNPEALAKRAKQQLMRLAQITEELANLRLFESNPDTDAKLAHKKT